MNHRWKLRSKSPLIKKAQAYITRSARIHPKARITGKIFISDNVTIGQSNILAEDDHSITIGKNTTIKDGVLITSKDNKFELKEIDIKKAKDILIGDKVFISSDVFIYGPTIISDGTFVGYNTTIVNCKIGNDCVIEDNVVIKNISIPAGTSVPSKSMIDSIEKLNQMILNTDQDKSHEYKLFTNSVFAKAV